MGLGFSLARIKIAKNASPSSRECTPASVKDFCQLLSKSNDHGIPEKTSISLVNKPHNSAEDRLEGDLAAACSKPKKAATDLGAWPDGRPKMAVS